MASSTRIPPAEITGLQPLATPTAEVASTA
jgi:hypothetical protein